MAAVPGPAAIGGRLRLARFAVVGIGVMAAGFLVLAVLVEVVGVGKHLAYFIQALFSIEASFLLSRAWTWADRRGEGRGALAADWLRFHSSRLLSVPANQALFSLLVVIAVPYLIANAVCIAVTSAVNFGVAHHFVFRTPRSPQQ